MATATKSTTKTKDFTEPLKEFSGLFKENYKNGLDFTFSVLEQNIKAVNAQVDQWFELEKDYFNTLDGYYKDLPRELPFVNGNIKPAKEQLDRLVALRKDQVENFKTMSEKVLKETRSYAEENTDKAFSIFEDYLNTLKI